MGTLERLGKYEIVRALGSGGMAETYLARMVGEAGVDKQVVIKRVLANRAKDEAFVRAFIDEARLSASLSHANIVQVFDFGRHGDEHFLAMEYVRGIDLAELLQRSREQGFAHLPAALACAVVRDALRGLHYAHTRTDPEGRPLGIVHRDVSPSNVLVGFEGEVKIIDFGVAKARLAGRQDTEPGIVKGKLQYMSPEQASLEPLDARSDVFATGVVLYELLSGRRPFTGSGAAVLHSIVRGEFPSLLAVNERLPSTLATVVAQALGHRRDARFQSAAAFADALDRVLRQELPACSAADVGWFAATLAGASQGPGGGPPPDFLERFESWRRQCAGRPFLEDGAQRAEAPPAHAPTRAEWKQTPHDARTSGGAGASDASADTPPARDEPHPSWSDALEESPHAGRIALGLTLTVIGFSAVVAWHELRGTDGPQAATEADRAARPVPGPRTPPPAEEPGPAAVAGRGEPPAPAPSNRFNVGDVVVPVDPVRHALRVRDTGPPATVQLAPGATLPVSRVSEHSRLPLMLTARRPGPWQVLSKLNGAEMLVGPGVFRFFVADAFTVLGPEAFGVRLEAPLQTIGFAALATGVEVTPAVVGLPDLEGRYVFQVRGPPGAQLLVLSDHVASAQTWHEPVGAGRFFAVTGASRVGFAVPPGNPTGPVSVLVAAEQAMTPGELAMRACAVAKDLRTRDPEAARFADMTCRSRPDSRTPGTSAEERGREDAEIQQFLAKVREVTKDGRASNRGEAAQLVSQCIERFPDRCDCMRVGRELQLPFEPPMKLERACSPVLLAPPLQEEPSIAEERKLRRGIEAVRSLKP